MTTVRHVSQCSSLRYSFSFSHKCPGLVGASSELQSDALCENTHHHADCSSAQWSVTTLVRYATRTVLAESCASAGHQGKAFDRCQCCRSHCCSNSLKQYPYNFECIRLLLLYSVIFRFVIFQAVIFQSCKFQSCEFSYPNKMYRCSVVK